MRQQLLFLEKEPPLNKRLRRMYVFLSQLRLKIYHLPGLKNELCDFLSRNVFEEKLNVEFDSLVKDDFTKMDSQLDLWLHKIMFLSEKFTLTPEDYQDDDLKETWQTIPLNKTHYLDGNVWFKTETKLFCERKLVVPQKKLDEVLKVSHETNNHPGPERTLLFFLSHFYSFLTKNELFLKCKRICDSCATCLLAKPNRSTDRGEISSLAIPQICNDIM